MSPRPSLAVGAAGEAWALLECLAAGAGLSGPFLAGRDPHGRPTLSAEGRPVPFSLSRARGRCAVALALEGRVGVDLAARLEGDPDLLEAHFHPAERGWLRELREEDRRLAATRCWAAKEAVLKGLGLGLPFGLDAVELIPAGGTLRVARIAGQPAEGWSLEISGDEGLVLALAWAP